MQTDYSHITFGDIKKGFGTEVMQMVSAALTGITT